MNDDDFGGSIGLDKRAAALAALDRSAGIQRHRIGRPSGEGHWHIARAVGKSDQFTLDWLKRMNIESWYPHIMQQRPVPRRQLSAAQRRSGIEILKPTLAPMFPRYIFVDLRTGDDWAAIARFAGLSGLWCEGGVPVRMRDADLNKIRSRERDGAVPGTDSVRAVFAIGDQVVVNNGPFASFPGIVEKGLDVAIGELDPETRIKVAVSIFGRATPVELEVWQVSKMD